MSNTATSPATQASPARRAVDTVKSLVARPEYAERFKQVLGERAPQFVSSLIQASGSFQLATCDPRSVIAAAMTAAALDLPIDKNLGFAHIVPYKGVAQFQMGYKGFVQLGLRSGQYRHLNASEIYEGELEKYDRIKGEVIVDVAKRKSDKIIGYVAYLQLLNGFEHAEYWTVEEIDSHANQYSQAVIKKKQDSPWFTNRPAMCKKTVIKDLISHWGPMSVQMQRAILEDQGARSAVGAEIVYPDNEKIVSATGDLGFIPTAEEVPAGVPPEVEGTLSDAEKLVADLRERMEAGELAETTVMAGLTKLGLAKPDQDSLSQLSLTKLKALSEGWDELSKGF